MLELRASLRPPLSSKLQTQNISGLFSEDICFNEIAHAVCDARWGETMAFLSSKSQFAPNVNCSKSPECFQLLQVTHFEDAKLEMFSSEAFASNFSPQPCWHTFTSIFPESDDRGRVKTSLSLRKSNFLPVIRNPLSATEQSLPNCSWEGYANFRSDFSR